MIKIPEKYREQFDLSAEFAIKNEKFTVQELATELEVGELAASILVGYMEKTGLITKGKLSDVRRARISLEEWDRLDRRVENYVPLPEIKEEKFHAEIKEDIVTLEDIIPEKARFYKSEIEAKEKYLIIRSKEETSLLLDDIKALFLIKPKLFKKGALVFSSESEISEEKPSLRADTVLFSKKDYDKVKSLASSMAERLGVELK